MDEYYYMYMLPLLSDYIIQLNGKLETLQNGLSWDQNLQKNSAIMDRYTCRSFFFLRTHIADHYNIL